MTAENSSNIIYYDWRNNDPRLRRNCEFAGTEEEFKKFNAIRQSIIDQMILDYPRRCLISFAEQNIAVSQIEKPENYKKCYIDIFRINGVNPQERVGIQVQHAYNDDLAGSIQETTIEYKQLEFILYTMFSMSLARENWIFKNSDNGGSYIPPFNDEVAKFYKSYSFLLPGGVTIYSEDKTPQGDNGGQLYVISQIMMGDSGNIYGKVFDRERITYNFI